MSEDAIAMSDDAAWFAYSRSMTRGQVMASLAEACGSWQDAIHAYKIRAGHVTESEAVGDQEGGWWSECDPDTPGATPAWIVRGYQRERRSALGPAPIVHAPDPDDDDDRPF